MINHPSSIIFYSYKEVSFFLNEKQKDFHPRSLCWEIPLHIKPRRMTLYFKKQFFVDKVGGGKQSLVNRRCKSSKDHKHNKEKKAIMKTNIPHNTIY